MAPKRRKKPGGPPGHKKAPYRKVGRVKVFGATADLDGTAIVKRNGTADPHLQSIYLNLLNIGMTYERAAEITQFSDSAWDKQARIDADFGGRRAAARERGPSFVTGLVAKAMLQKIAEGNPWWVRFAIINGYCRGMRDPDAEIAQQIADAPKRIVIVVSPEGARHFKGLHGDNGNGHGGNGSTMKHVVAHQVGGGNGAHALTDGGNGDVPHTHAEGE